MAITGRFLKGPGGTGWAEAHPTDVATALNLAVDEARKGDLGVVFVHFNNADLWDPNWGEWSWLQQPYPARPKRRVGPRSPTP